MITYPDTNTYPDTTTTYNGWANRATWLVALHFDLDNIFEDVENRDELASSIEALVSDLVYEQEQQQPPNGFVADLVPSASSAADTIDYDELAATYDFPCTAHGADVTHGEPDGEEGMCDLCHHDSLLEDAGNAAYDLFKNGG